MATCMYCGSQIPDGLKFCTNCGAALPVEAQAVQPVDAGYQQPVYQQQPYDQQSQQPYNQGQPAYGNPAPAANDSGSIGWGILGFIIPIVGIILYFVWRNTKPNSAKAAGLGAAISVVLAAIMRLTGIY